MAATGSENKYDGGRERRELLLFLLILLLGFICLLAAAQIAVRPDRLWPVSANMLSELDPDEGFDSGGVAVEPLRPEVMTPPPWDPRRILTPAGTAVVVPPATFAPAPTSTPTRQAAASAPTPTASATPPSPTPTSTPTPTPTSTPTRTPTPTPTPISTPTRTPTATSTPKPTSKPTQPSSPTTKPPTDTPTPTTTATHTPIPPPVVLSITPDQGVNSAPVPVVITGENFFGIPTATLRINVPIAISAATANTLTGTVPAGLIPGVYALTVRNPDGQPGWLSPAYTALSPDTMLQTGLVSTFGTGASPDKGDNDHVQVIFLEIPDAATDTLYVYLFDADTGGALDEQLGGGWDTATTFSLYGGNSAYTSPAARQAAFATTTDPGIDSGTLVVSQTFAISDALNIAWHLFATIDPAQGEAVGNKRVFKLSVVGANGGDDGNLYNVALSTSGSSPNEAPAGSRVFAYSWTFPLAPDVPRWLHPHVPGGTEFFEQHNWDMDSPVGTMTLYTPIRGIDVPGDHISGNDVEAWSTYRVDSLEDEATWTVRMQFRVPGSWNDLTFWVEDGTGEALAIFTRPTRTPPP